MPGLIIRSMLSFRFAFFFCYFALVSPLCNVPGHHAAWVGNFFAFLDGRSQLMLYLAYSFFFFCFISFIQEFLFLFSSNDDLIFYSTLEQTSGPEGNKKGWIHLNFLYIWFIFGRTDQKKNSRFGFFSMLNVFIFPTGIRFEGKLIIYCSPKVA